MEERRELFISRGFGRFLNDNQRGIRATTLRRLWAITYCVLHLVHPPTTTRSWRRVTLCDPPNHAEKTNVCVKLVVSSSPGRLQWIQNFLSHPPFAPVTLHHSIGMWHGPFPPLQGLWLTRSTLSLAARKSKRALPRSIRHPFLPPKV